MIMQMWILHVSYLGRLLLKFLILVLVLMRALVALFLINKCIQIS